MYAGLHKILARYRLKENIEKDTGKLAAIKTGGTECTQLMQTPLVPEEYKVTKRLWGQTTSTS